MGLQLAYNPGAAFSFGESFTWVFALIAVAATATAIVFAFRVRRPGWAIVIGALGGAAASHAGDRLFRQPGFAQGHVVDFLAYGNWFIGNLADVAIGAGVVLYALGAWRLHAASRTPAAVEPARGDDAELPTPDPVTTPAETTQP